MASEQVAVKEDTAGAVQTMAPKAVRRSRRSVEITIFDKWCKGCGLCSTFCPTQAITADEEGRPKAVDATRCSGCAWCVMHCPDLAITIRSSDPVGERS